MAIKTKCIYCGGSNHGAGCPYSPDRYHVHSGDPNACIYCGSPQTGSNCPYSPNRMHVKGMVMIQPLKRR